jgi:hypothetical protein
LLQLLVLLPWLLQLYRSRRSRRRCGRLRAGPPLFSWIHTAWRTTASVCWGCCCRCRRASSCLLRWRFSALMGLRPGGMPRSQPIHLDCGREPSIPRPAPSAQLGGRLYDSIFTVAPSLQARRDPRSPTRPQPRYSRNASVHSASSAPWPSIPPIGQCLLAHWAQPSLRLAPSPPRSRAGTL